MDAQLYSDAIKYEQLTKAVYQRILDRADGNNVLVQHNVELAGRSGVKHQIDVLWKFRLAGIEHTVIVECKNYCSAITLEKVRNIFAVAHDVGNCNPVMVTKVGYQSGAADFAKHYNISLKILRPPEDADWDGRVRVIHVRVHAKSLATEPAPICEFAVQPISPEQGERIENLQSLGRFNINTGADFRFVDSEGNAFGEEMRYWLPRHADTLSKDPGGPYEQRIPLKDHYALINQGLEGEELVKVAGVILRYYVEEESEEIVHDSSETVEAILKDYYSGEIEHFHEG